MNTDDALTIKLIFAFKLKLLRLQKKLSYQELSDMTGLSTSYLHDIEKAKKYPKVDKINALAKALNVTYDYLVSTTASKKLQPIIELLNSEFFKIFPLEMFGISNYKLFELFTNTPDKVNAFLSTIFKITRNYQMRSEHFYQAALRSYQEMYDNYFEDLEQAVQAFKQEKDLSTEGPYSTNTLIRILISSYGIQVDRQQLVQYEELKDCRSYYSEAKKVLYLNQNLSAAQEKFLLGRELAFQYLGLTERPYITRIVEVDSFEQLLNNFKASYFSIALLMGEMELVRDVQEFLGQPHWEAAHFLHFLEKYDVTPEMLMQRLTNILPKHFGIDDLFFLRLQGNGGHKGFKMTKELHLSRLHSPYANYTHEHYCRRWVAINILEKLRNKSHNELLADLQISDYWESNNEYLCISVAKQSHETSEEGVSVTLGLRVNPRLKKLVGFLQDPALETREVNTTCERCAISDCEVRAMAPVILDKKRKVDRIKAIVQEVDNEGTMRF
ncbi:helix-turn-helix domain-containing protein [Rapidithrix thailandica]|uniref:Helix-turn-helix domain-containing protein n=1 Tax=Rapidithrix thailandica TaxID=413964 RepID=A0AAW9SJX1_9BACT